MKQEEALALVTFLEDMLDSTSMHIEKVWDFEKDPMATYKYKVTRHIGKVDTGMAGNYGTGSTLFNALANLHEQEEKKKRSQESS